jgi:hypothetical protein
MNPFWLPDLMIWLTNGKVCRKAAKNFRLAAKARRKTMSAALIPRRTGKELPHVTLDKLRYFSILFASRKLIAAIFKAGLPPAVLPLRGRNRH